MNARALLRILRKPMRSVLLDHGHNVRVQQRYTDFLGITFQDGTRLTFHVVELDCDYAIQPTLWDADGEEVKP